MLPKINTNAAHQFTITENNSISIEGFEGIDGRNCFDEIGEEKYRGPHAINMWYCKNVRLEGYTIVDSANWAHAIQNSENITARNITVLGGHDGLDVRTCDNVEILGCTFKTGDDCIAGFDNNDVHVRDCYFESSCSLLRFGGNNVLVEDCVGVAPALNEDASYHSYGHSIIASPWGEVLKQASTKEELIIWCAPVGN